MSRTTESKFIAAVGIAVGTAALVGSLVALELGAVTVKEAGIIGGSGDVLAVAFFALKS